MSADIPGAVEWLRQFPALDAERDPRIRELFTQAQVVRLPVGQPVFHAGAACRHYLLVIEGEVRVYMVSDSGREVTLYRVGRGGSCVLTTSCLLGGEVYPAAAITESAVTAVVMPFESFEAAMDGSRVFRGFVFANLGQRLAQVIHRMEEVALGGIDARLIHLVLARMDADKVVDATHEAMARELGTAREVVSRHLKRFEAQGLLHLRRGKVQVAAVDALRKLVGSM